jgi:hypothetical protein
MNPNEKLHENKIISVSSIPILSGWHPKSSADETAFLSAKRDWQVSPEVSKLFIHPASQSLRNIPKCENLKNKNANFPIYKFMGTYVL